MSLNCVNNTEKQNNDADGKHAVKQPFYHQSEMKCTFVPAQIRAVELKPGTFPLNLVLFGEVREPQTTKQTKLPQPLKILRLGPSNGSTFNNYQREE